MSPLFWRSSSAFARKPRASRKAAKPMLQSWPGCSGRRDDTAIQVTTGGRNAPALYLSETSHADSDRLRDVDRHGVRAVKFLRHRHPVELAFGRLRGFPPK